MVLSSDPCDVSWHFLAVPVLVWWLGALSSNNCKFITCPRIVTGAVYNILVGTFHVLSLSERILLTARFEAKPRRRLLYVCIHDVVTVSVFVEIRAVRVPFSVWFTSVANSLIFCGYLLFVFPVSYLSFFFYRFVRLHVPESEPVLYNSCSVDARERDFSIEMVYNVCVSLRVLIPSVMWMFPWICYCFY